MKHDRFSPSDVEAWRRDGAVVIENFFTPVEVAAVVADFETVFGLPQGQEEALVKRKPGEAGKFNPSQFTGVKAIPFACSPALNLIGLHPALIAFAREALACEEVQLYQCQAWVKYTGEADYDQPLHCDFVNHTLTVPSPDAHLNSIPIICYFSDVSEAHGPMHFVTRPDSAKVAGPEATLEFDPHLRAQLQSGLHAYERSSASPAGSITPYGIDIYHRGSNLTAPHGHRYAVMACFKRAGDESIGYHAWPFHVAQPWRHVFEHATPDQLACFGVKRPGDPFWSDVTLKRAQARYPGWDLTPYRQAL